MKGRLALFQTAGTLAATSCATLERRFGVRFSVGHQRVEGPESDNTGDHDCSALGIVGSRHGVKRARYGPAASDTERADAAQANHSMATHAKYGGPVDN